MQQHAPQFAFYGLCSLSHQEYRHEVFLCSEGFVSNTLTFPLLRRTDSSLHATNTLFNISSLQDTFWKGATLNMMLSRRVMATTFITATCKIEQIKHRKYAVMMDKKFLWCTLSIVAVIDFLLVEDAARKYRHNIVKMCICNGCTISKIC